MCCFSQPIHTVSSTNIFARGLPDGRQVLVYEMKVAMKGPVAMVLPLPLPAHPPEDALRFVDLSGYPDFFRDMEKGFPILARGRGRRSGPAPRSSRRPLVVHRVGQFIASFVPGRGDFDRLDPRFRLSDTVLDAMVDQADYSFAVFQLDDPDSPSSSPEAQPDRPRFTPGRARAVRRTPRRASAAPSPTPIHPMAMVFPRRDPGSLFFPTVHVHDGAVHAEAHFDHALFCQQDSPPQSAQRGWGSYWRQSSQPTASFLAVDRTQGLVDAEQPCWKCSLNGMLPNRDVRIR